MFQPILGEKGKFIDMTDVRQSLVNGEVPYATAAVGE